jgi:hypothetical protein
MANLNKTIMFEGKHWNERIYSYKKKSKKTKKKMKTVKSLRQDWR